MITKDNFMLCSSCQDDTELKEFDRQKWKANIKFDGVRCVAIKQGSDIILFGRRESIMNKNFREVVEALKEINSDFIIDGEIISLDNNFNNLQRRALTKDIKKIAELEKSIPIKYMVFDILKFGKDILMKEPLRNRLSCLNSLIKNNNAIELCEYGEIDDMLNRAIEKQGEGIVIKDMGGIYEGKRSKLWFKHKLFKETTLEITGFTENPKGIRATDNEGNAVQISGEQSQEVKAELRAKGHTSIHIQYLSKGETGRYRFPSYRGLVC
jgi:ATP-dependent DNA ligase